ncbi:Cuticle protein [Frankliniella fusca]|uniref:Cuticle protein n=1 Tax=Frankliniella fusca TaxID=407009 RepID=A0AAE1LQ74_9NEOP|nr:Cuticle protein [Frankliniella fusca]
MRTAKQEQSSDDGNEYTFEYAVRDTRPDRRDPKPSREERRRAGGVVLGSYSLLSPDGSQRTVQYSAHPVHGLTAVVRRDAGVGAALFVRGPFPTAAPTPTVVLVRPHPQVLFGPTATASGPQQIVYQGVDAGGPPSAPQLLQVVTPSPVRVQVHPQQVESSTPLPSARLVAVDVQRPLEPSAEDAVVNIGGRDRPSAAAAVPSGRVRVQQVPQHLLLSAQALPVLALGPAPLAGTNGSPASSFFFFGQQHQQAATAAPAPPAAQRAFFSFPLLQHGPSPTGAPSPASGQTSAPALYRFPHPDPPVHFATSGQGYTSAVFTAFSNPYVSYAY